MQVKLKDIKLKAATLIETIIALLILMISFYAGIVIYTRVMLNGINNEQLRANAELIFLADSLNVAKNSEPLILVRNQKVYQFGYTTDERYAELLLMRMTCADEKGLRLAEHFRWITNDEARKN